MDEREDQKASPPERPGPAKLEELREQNHLKEQLFTICAHDLRGPIGSVRDLVGMACDHPEDLDAETLGTYLPEMRRSLDAVCGLLDNMLWWVRGQMSEITVLRKRFPLSEVLGAAVAVLSRAADAKGVAVEVDCPSRLTVLSDQFIVETIVRNFLSNGIKYSNPGSAVRVTAAGNGEAIRIEVTDCGVGMDRDRLQGLFAPKISRGATGTGGERGSGLGLMFCADLAKRIGAALDAASEPGRGTTVGVSIPDVLDGVLEEA